MWIWYIDMVPWMGLIYTTWNPFGDIDSDDYLEMNVKSTIGGTIETLLRMMEGRGKLVGLSSRPLSSPVLYSKLR
jgi:hypothetical protein